jgi:hypothetical protein
MNSRLVSLTICFSLLIVFLFIDFTKYEKFSGELLTKSDFGIGVVVALIVGRQIWRSLSPK